MKVKWTNLLAEEVSGDVVGIDSTNFVISMPDNSFIVRPIFDCERIPEDDIYPLVIGDLVMIVGESSNPVVFQPAKVIWIFPDNSLQLKFYWGGWIIYPPDKWKLRNNVRAIEVV